jgi:hypothetical protein
MLQDFNSTAWEEVIMKLNQLFRHGLLIKMRW